MSGNPSVHKAAYHAPWHLISPQQSSFNNVNNMTEWVVSPWMELLLLEPCECPSCPSLIASKDPHNYSFKCLRPYHAADSIKKSRPCIKCRAPPMATGLGPLSLLTGWVGLYWESITIDVSIALRRHSSRWKQWKTSTSPCLTQWFSGLQHQSD